MGTRTPAGYLPLDTWFRVPVRLHWTAIIGAALLGRLRFVPVFWAGLFVLIVLHEFGHAIVIRAFKLRVVAIELNALGGLCHWSGVASPRQRSLIAWGGVTMQGALLVAALVVGAVVPANALPWFVRELLDMLVGTNLVMIAINLLPFGTLDGVQAWQLPKILWRGQRKDLRKDRVRQSDRRAREALALVADLNDGKLSPELQETLDRVARDAARSGAKKKSG